MRHSQLKAFHAVASHGGFSRAAEHLGISQPSVSEQVRALEQAHDVLLFDRQRRQVQLTAAGRALLQLTRRYFEVEDQIADHLSAASTAIEGKLRIIADAAHHITDILNRFTAQHPRVRVTIRTGNSDAILTALRHYEAEIGIVGSADPGHDMETIDLGRSEIVAFAANGVVPNAQSTLPLAKIAEYPLVHREPGSKTRARVQELASRLGVQLNPAIEAEGRDAVREIVASGAGIGFVSRAEYTTDSRLRLYPIADAHLEMQESLVHLTTRRDVRVIRAFTEVARHVTQG